MSELSDQDIENIRQAGLAGSKAGAALRDALIGADDTAESATAKTFSRKRLFEELCFRNAETELAVLQQLLPSVEEMNIVELRFMIKKMGEHLFKSTSDEH